MSVSDISSVGRVEPPSTVLRPPGNPPRPPGETPAPTAGQSGPDESAARRFPWLSWQNRELEMASKQPSPYGNIPLLGKELDQQV